MKIGDVIVSKKGICQHCKTGYVGGFTYIVISIDEDFDFYVVSEYCPKTKKIIGMGVSRVCDHCPIKIMSRADE